MSKDVLLGFILAATLIGFVWGHWRYDVVAGLALLAAVTINADKFPKTNLD